MIAKRIIVLFLASLITTTLSILIILAVGKIALPLQEPTDHDTKDEFIYENEGRILSEQEVEESARIARGIIEQKIQAAKEKERNMGFDEFIKPAKSRAVYLTWLPWLIMPFLVSTGRGPWIFLTLLIPVLLMHTGIFILIEIIVFGVGLLAGLWVSKMLRMRPL